MSDVSAPSATIEQARQLPGFDPTPAITSQEAGLVDYLSLPTRTILDRLGLSAPVAAAPTDPEGERDPALDEQPFAPPSPVDPMQMISPVTDALGTLGTGLFDSVDPTSMFSGITEALDSAGRTVSPAVGALAADWQGASGSAAADAARAALVSGSDVGAQSSGLRASLTNAAAVVAQARARHIEIIAEFQATIAAIGPNIIFPWGWAAAVAAATRAVTASVEVVTETQASLAGEASTTSAIGAPVAVSAAPTLLTNMMGPLAGMATGMIGPLTSLAGQGGSTTTDPRSTPTGKSDAAPPPVGGAEAGGAVGGAAGGGAAGATGTAAPKPSAPMVAPSAVSAAAAAAPAGTGRGGTPAMPFMGAPMTGAGLGAASATNGHTAASFLHTGNQGGEIVGDLEGVAPPVIGEIDSHQSPDIDLRI
ncbi:hypothetical protein [Mycolicibacterium arenosum]|uniref:PPE family protein n=1 Tax=Mycolicibacterium arenosum TaxID=2952157 RepID=A0ABT1LXC4_9MYCO|nr:hypothetical protein [Mycolicibacterium sp. CAU 1645]MCP9271540.1 hypothetical protein [Mycolicibacterium sp. CAU 1645]